jgi:hypothetical protein
MIFQVQNGGAYSFMNQNNAFVGFLVIGAFLYPSGNSIFHDPQFQSTATTLVIDPHIPAFPPTGALALQMIIAVAGIALAVAAGIFVKKHAGQTRRSASVTRERTSPTFPRPPENPPIEPPAPPLSGGKDQ